MSGTSTLAIQMRGALAGEPLAAVITASPLEKAVTSPAAETCATKIREELQVT